MAWADRLLDASFRGIIFDCISTDDAGEHALAKHEYPYVDGADVEHMGSNARNISVQAVFYGDEYETRLQGFIAALDGEDKTLNPEDAVKGGWLQHPVFGMLFVQVASYRIHHEADDVDQASITIEFVESTPSAPFFAQELATQKADAASQHGQAAISSASERAANLLLAIQASNPLNGLDKLRQALTAPLLDIMAVGNIVLSGLDPLAFPRAWANDIAALAGGILDARDWALDVRAQWPSILSSLHAFSIFSTPPASVTQASPSLPPTQDQGIAAAAATVQVIVTSTLAEGAGTLLKSEISTPTLTPTEIEALANTTRTQIDAAIAQVRALYSLEDAGPIVDALKNQALAIQEAAASVIAGRPPLIQRTITAPGNFRLQAHRWYGDSDRAAELYMLNGARSPFTTPGEVVDAYAS
jgi:prophage DNA circulation protein